VCLLASGELLLGEQGASRITHKHWDRDSWSTAGQPSRPSFSGSRPSASRSACCIDFRRRLPQNVTTREDIASVAEQLADLTRTVEAMAKDLKSMTERADRQQARADSQQDLVDSQQNRAQMQQERIDLAAKELADVSDRLQAAATALRDSV
jgi:methyl-accepting chemotaxis protein